MEDFCHDPNREPLPLSFRPFSHKNYSIKESTKRYLSLPFSSPLFSLAMSSDGLSVLLCGGGNAIHVLTAYVSSLPNCKVNVLSLFPGEAERLASNITNQGIKCINDLGPDRFGKPEKCSDDPAIAVDADVVILAIPSFTHELYLTKLKPYLKKGVVLGAMPGEGGFDFQARTILGDEFVNASSLFALETLPWACRIVEYGKSVEVLGTKKEIDVVITPPLGVPMDKTLDTLQTIVGSAPKMVPACNFLAVTLMNINSVSATKRNRRNYKQKANTPYSHWIFLC